MQYRQDWTKRIGLALVIAATGSLAADTAEAAGHQGRSGHGHTHGPIFKTLDALAGGIESVLERTVLSGRKSSACDAISCDDACDHGTLQLLDPYWASGVNDVQAPKSSSDEPAPRAPHGYGLSNGYQVPQSQPSATSAAPNGASSNAGLVPIRPLNSASNAAPLPRTSAPPSTLPRVPADPPAPQPLPDSSARPLTTEEGWIESFNPSQPSGQQAAPRVPRSQPRQGLSDPFSDDPSGGF